MTSEADDAGRPEAFLAVKRQEMDAMLHDAVRQEARASAMFACGVWCPTDEQIAAELPAARRMLEREAGLPEGELDAYGAVQP